MSVQVENTEKNTVKLTITVDAAQFNEAMNKSYLKVRRNINIPGFRNGKAPRVVIENHYSEAVFYEEAVNELLPDAYDGAVQESGISPVDQPDIDIAQIGSGKDLIITATVTVKPEVILGKYKGIEQQKPEYTVTDENVQEEIDRALDRVARWVDVTDRNTVEQGDRITLDYSGAVDGVKFDGGTAQDQTLDIGSGTFIPGFEESLIGAEIGKELDINVTFPAEYQSEELAGKDAVFTVTVHSIKVKEVPALDDDFVKDTSEMETVDEYKQDIRDRLTQTNETRANNEFYDALMEAVIADTQMEIPECMIERQVDYILREMEYRMSYQGIRLEDYLKYTGMDMENLRRGYHSEGLKRVQTQLVMEAIQAAEDIQVTDEDFEAELQKIAENTKQDIEQVRAMVSAQDAESFRSEIKADKTLKLLADQAVAAPDKTAAAGKDETEEVSGTEESDKIASEGK